VDLDQKAATMRQVSARLLPFLLALYFVAYVDRVNVGIAALQMNADLNFGDATFGFGAGIFFLGYALFEIPSNIILARVGARRWLARIAITWGLLTCAMLAVRTPTQFYVARFALGVAEAGLFPGVIYYLSQWFPQSHRARALAGFMIASPLAQVIGGPVGGALLGLRGTAGLGGWQWLFLIEGLPAVVLGVIALYWLDDRPAEATWLTHGQRAWLTERIATEARHAGGEGASLQEASRRTAALGEGAVRPQVPPARRDHRIGARQARRRARARGRRSRPRLGNRVGLRTPAHRACRS